jgi:tocopherol cyclase
VLYGFGGASLNIKKIWQPEVFQGENKRRNYFEGWYFKLIDKDRKTVLAVIPGIALGKSPKDAHSFIQVIDAVSGKTEYHRFAYEDFKTDKTRFSVQIGPNEFSDSRLKLELNHGDQPINGELFFHNIIKYPVSFLSPGIMGPFSFVPCMECYHGVVNIHHTISGTLSIGGWPVDMSGGYGYIEKDWGESFPDSWIWLQANHFEQQGISFMFSKARIPWLGRSFTGLISFLQTDQGFYKFTTYNGSKITHMELDGDILEAVVSNAKHILKFTTKYAKGGILKAPKNGLMHREIEESITAEIAVHLSDLNGNTLFQGTSKWVGLELCEAEK